MLRAGTVWDARPLQWRHFHDDRLHGASLQVGSGRQEVLCYCINALSGARWSAALKKRTQNLLQGSFT